MLQKLSAQPDLNCSFTYFPGGTIDLDLLLAENHLRQRYSPFMSTAQKLTRPETPTEFPLSLELVWVAPTSLFTVDNLKTASKDEILKEIFDYRKEGQPWSLADLIADWELEACMRVTLAGHVISESTASHGSVQADTQLYSLNVQATGSLDCRFIRSHTLRGGKLEMTVESALSHLRNDDDLWSCFVSAGLFEQPSLDVQEMCMTLRPA